MHRLSTLTAVAAVSLSGLSLTSTAAQAWCGDSYKAGGHTKCVRVIGGSLAVVTHPDGNAIVCRLKDGRKFWAPRAAGSRDGTRWYSVRLDSGTGFFSEFRTVRGRRHLNIEGC